MTPLEQQLRRITADWRATATAWTHEQQRARTAGAPPQSGHFAIANWVNWLNGCAQQVDDAIDAYGSDR